MTDDLARERLAEILDGHTPGGLLQLLAEVLVQDTPADDTAGESLRDVVGALNVLDLVYPSSEGS